MTVDSKAGFHRTNECVRIDRLAEDLRVCGGIEVTRVGARDHEHGDAPEIRLTGQFQRDVAPAEDRQSQIEGDDIRAMPLDFLEPPSDN